MLGNGCLFHLVFSVVLLLVNTGMQSDLRTPHTELIRPPIRLCIGIAGLVCGYWVSEVRIIVTYV